MDCLKININEYLDLLRNNQDSMSTSAIISSLDHKLAKISKKDRLHVLKSVNEVDLIGINHKDSVLIAAMIEFAYNENSRSTKEKRFMSDKYTLKSIMDNSFLVYFKTPEQKKKQAEIAIKAAAPELQWRNMVGEKVIDSV